MGKKIQHTFNRLKTNLRNMLLKVESVVERRPLSSFFVVLLILLILIIVSNFLNKPQSTAEEVKVKPKEVQIYKIGTAPKVSAQAQIEKTGVITITALMSGVINEINTSEGMKVGRGANLIWMTNNYQGGNIFSLQRQMAATQYQNTLDTYNTQKDIIFKQRDIAAKTKSNSDELRGITDDSIDETKSLISLNEDIVDSLSSSIDELEDSGADESAVRGQKQLLSQILAGLNQARAALRQSEYQVKSDKPPAKLAELQYDITVRQLDLQERALNLGVEIGRLQLQIAQVNEASMHPVAPISGVVQKVHVRLGQAVNPGQALVTIAGDAGELNAVAYVPQSMAQSISRIESSFLYIGTNKISATPVFISTEATQGNLYAVKFVIPAEYYANVTDKSFIRVEIPIGYADTTASIPFIPLDSVYQSKEKAYVFVNEKGLAKNRSLILGEVFGQFVRVDSGLRDGDKIILNRNVIEGDQVTEL